jgi:hypothetical protein
LSQTVCACDRRDFSSNFGIESPEECKSLSY